MKKETFSRKKLWCNPFNFLSLFLGISRRTGTGCNMNLNGSSFITTWVAPFVVSVWVVRCSKFGCCCVVGPPQQLWCTNYRHCVDKKPNYRNHQHDPMGKVKTKNTTKRKSLLLESSKKSRVKARKKSKSHNIWRGSETVGQGRMGWDHDSP